MQKIKHPHRRLVHNMLSWSVLICTCFLFLCPIVNANPTSNIPSEQSDISLTCKSAILMEADTGTIIYETNADEQLRPASITKIMTLLLIFEALEQQKIALNDMVTVSAHAASMGGSQVYLEENEQQSVEDLIKCISIASANDASVAMAEYLSGTEEAFVQEMNKKAKELKMTNTHFVNCCGLDADGHLTSARDVAIMSKELITNYPEIHHYSTIWMDKIYHTKKNESTEFGLSNTNKLISTYPYATGLKTGSTSLAKYSVSATATKDDLSLIAVIMADENYKTRFTNAQKLLDYGFSLCKKYSDTAPPKLTPISVSKGEQTSVSLCYRDTFTYIDAYGNNINEIKSKVNLPNYLEAPLNKNSSVGTLDYYLNDKLIGSIAIYPEADVKELSFLYCLKTILNNMI